ncbi:MAG: transcriptional regulator [Clostridia bacterium]|jgi:AraC family transcriptional regulator|nr:transcriptional regulator [Clostridia bacterium]
MMEGKVITLKGFKAVGLTYFGDNKKGEIPSLWDTFNKQFSRISQKSMPMLCYGVCDDMPDSECRFHYTACVAVDAFSDVPEGMDTKTIPAGKYLVYTYTGSINDLGSFYDTIFSTWFPNSPYEMDMRPQLELYDERFMRNGEFDIYVPIK